MGFLDSSQYQAKLVSACPEHPVWIYIICFLAVSDLKTTVGAILAHNCTGKHGPSFLKFNLGIVTKSLLWEITSSVCIHTSGPALHLSGWDLWKEQNSPAHSMKWGQWATNTKIFSAWIMIKYPWVGRWALKMDESPTSRYRCLEVTGFRPCVTTEILYTESGQLLFCICRCKNQIGLSGTQSIKYITDLKLEKWWNSNSTE